MSKVLFDIEIHGLSESDEEIFAEWVETTLDVSMEAILGLDTHVVLEVFEGNGRFRLEACNKIKEAFPQVKVKLFEYRRAKTPKFIL